MIADKESKTIVIDKYAHLRDKGTEFDSWYFTVAYAAALKPAFSSSIPLLLSNSYSSTYHYGFSYAYTFWNYTTRVNHIAFFTFGRNFVFNDQYGFELYIGGGVTYSNNNEDAMFNWQLVYKAGVLLPYRIDSDCIVVFIEILTSIYDDYESTIPSGLIQVGVGYSI